MIKCPNKSSKEYKNLEARVGSVMAHSLFNEFDEDYDAINKHLNIKEVEEAGYKIEDKLLDIRDRLNRLRLIYNRRKNSARLDTELDKIGKLLDELDAKESTLDKLQGIVDYIHSSAEIIDLFEETMKDIKRNPNDLNNIHRLVGVHRFTSVFNNLKELQSFFMASLEAREEEELEKAKWLVGLHQARLDGTEEEFLDENDEPKGSISILNDAVVKLNNIHKDYQDLGAPLLAKKLWTLVDPATVELAKTHKAKLLKSNPKSAQALTIITSEEDLVAHLMKAAKDLDGYDKWLYSTAGSADPVLALLTKHIIDSQTEVTELLMSDAEYMGSAYESYAEESGLNKNNTDTFNDAILDTYTRVDEEGKETTYYKLVEQYDVEQFKKDVTAFYEDVGFLKESNNEEDNVEFNKLQSAFYEKNTQQKPKEEILAIIADKKANLSERRFEEWFAKNTLRNADGSVKRYIRELANPVKVNPKWVALQNNPAALEYYNKVRTFYDSILQELSYDKREFMKNKLPFVYKSGFIDRVNSQGIDGAKQNLKDKVKVTSGDVNYGIVNTEGEEHKEIPIHYASEIEAKDASTDVFEVMLAAAKSWRTYAAKANILDDIVLAEDVLQNQKIDEVNAKGEHILDKVSKKLDKNIKQQRASNILERFRSMTDTRFYGKEDEKQIVNVFGQDVSIDKIASNFSLFTSIVNFTGNIIAGTSNFANGKFQNWIEAHADLHFSKKTMAHAELLATKNIPQALQDRRKSHDKSYLTQIAELFNFQNGSFMDSYGKNVSGNLLKKEFTTDNLFITMSAGEHTVAMSAGISFLLDTKLVNGQFVNRAKYLANLKGEEYKKAEKEFEEIETNLLDAYEKKANGVIGLKDEYKGIVTKETVRDIRMLINGVNEKLQGNFSAEDKAQIQRVWWGKLAIMYRKHIAPGLQRRFGKANINYGTGTLDEGSYSTTARIIYDFYNDVLVDVKELGYMEALNIWKENITEQDRQNIRRAITEIGLGLIMFFIVGAIGGDDDEVSKNTYAENLLALEARRLQSELWFYANPLETIRIMRSPAVAMSTIESLVKFGTGLVFIWGEEDVYKRDTGIHKKGDSKDWARFKKLVPGVKAFEATQTPEEMMKTFNRII